MPSSHQENPNPCTPPQLISKSHRPRPRTKFAHGSDLVLKSVDGEEFPAHSLILSLASPVFADMFESDSSCLGKTIELAETGEMIKLTLKFIYPGQFPTVSSFDVLEKALHVANKYQLDHMYQYLRQKLSEPDSTVSAYANSLSAFNVAMNHGLKDEMRLAASLAHDKHNFTTVDGLLELAKSTPAAITWIVVIGIPSVKNAIISEVLFDYSKDPMKLPTTSLCGPCGNWQANSGIRYSPPEWQARWCRELYSELMKQPMKSWETCFDLPFLHESISRNGGVPININRGICTCWEKLSASYAYPVYSCADFPGYDSDDEIDTSQVRKRTVPKSLSYFTQWSYTIYDHLTLRLECLEKLEGLVN